MSGSSPVGRNSLVTETKIAPEMTSSRNRGNRVLISLPGYRRCGVRLSLAWCRARRDPLDPHAGLRRPARDRACGQRRDRRGRRQHHRVAAVLQRRHRHVLHAPAGRDLRDPRRVRGGAGTGDRAVRDAVAARSGGPAAAHPGAGIHGGPRRQRPAVPAARGSAPGRHPAGAREPSRPRPAGGVLRRAVRVDAGHRPRAEGRLRAPGSRRGRRARHRAGGARPLHADPVAGAVRRPGGPDHQHPSLLPAGLQGRQPLQAGARPRREADRRHRALRHERPRRGPDHRAERGARRPHPLPRRADGHRSGRGIAHAHPGRPLVRRAPRAARRRADDHLPLMSTLLRGARLLDEGGEIADGWVLFDGDAIAATGSGAHPPADEVVELGDATLVPGFVDLHGHGGGGHQFDVGGDELVAGLAAHRAHGTTRSVVSLVANPVAELERALADVARLAAADPLVLGAHLEGPFLAPTRRGVHSEDFLRLPDAGTVDRLLDAAAGSLRQVTIAPELPGALDAVGRFTAAGARVAVGHTEADEQQAGAAFDAGATLLTHAFNAMPGIHHRAPGPVVAAIDDRRVTIELILDGLHVHPHVARLLWDAAPGRIALITDAMAAAAEADGDYRLGTLNVSVRNGLAVLSGTDTIAGSTLTQDVALRGAIGMGAEPAAAVGALTAVPARAIGETRLGRLSPGYAADVVALDPAWQVTAVWGAGRRLS